MNEVTERWIDAAMKLGKDKNEKVTCPACSAAVLKVKDEPYEPARKIDRYLFCESCGQWNVMTGNFPDSEFYFEEEAS
jgi:hypothetical protein